ncbi:MAG: acyl-ACP--UDP-N-acetylglucosamine O-acyltransferase [bacterium]|nr:acyl-ACP--UDP-N-acetylglucosamine O-acyltransferase [bacterium]
MSQPLANIHPDAKIAPNVKIEPFATIEENTTIDEGTWIGANAIISNGARIGKNCKIFPSAVVSAIPQDMKFQGEITETFIGDNTDIREFVTISRGTIEKHKTVIGSNCLIMAYSHIAHDCILGNHVILGNGVQMAGHVEVGDYAIISGTSAVHQFSKIGAHSIISGGSLVKKDIPPFTTAGRDPISYCGVNTIGLRRRGFQRNKILEIQEIYRTIFLSNLNNSQALERITNTINPSPERDEIITFINESERGIMKGFSK